MFRWLYVLSIKNINLFWKNLISNISEIKRDKSIIFRFSVIVQRADVYKI